MNLPSEFVEKITGAFGSDGTRWLENLEGLVAKYAEKWGLTIEGPAGNLTYNYVVKACDKEGTPVILKLGVPNYDFINEARTVRQYNGEACARLLAEDATNGAMLLEQLIPGQNLSVLNDEEQAAKEYIQVWKNIRRKLPNNFSPPSILDWAEGFTRYKSQFPDGGEPIPFEAIERANAYMKELHDPDQIELLHGDLHHENILLSERGWLAIDPKGVSGNPYYDIMSFLINHLHNKKHPRELLKNRINWICEGLGLDKKRLLKASYALGTLYACWGIEDHGEWKETYQCVEWIAEFLTE
ncbi:aminoglycoside phosphotransferase family protein [Bacillus sp. FJAT-18017]|uniref:aminoglycoside phosphotransferase family protein n=1 Tax=Bacillus sp. FJAT-18017 TaxID=1705566 RepID=UPI0006AEBE25|nr:aminoglycoside phosphotransferase family protein [Bacillus sp. FJAT-18017]